MEAFLAVEILVGELRPQNGVGVKGKRLAERCSGSRKADRGRDLAYAGSDGRSEHVERLAVCLRIQIPSSALEHARGEIGEPRLIGRVRRGAPSEERRERHERQVGPAEVL